MVEHSDGARPWRALEDVVAATAEAADGGTPTPIEVTLRDGSRAWLRPIARGDGERLRQGLQRLSIRSRYLRFHTPIRELSDEQVRYLTEVDHRDHVAWVALDPDHPERPGMGVARYIRLDEPHVAEAAVTVADEYQGLGLGTVLLGVIGRVAAANGVTVLRNYVLDVNEEMLGLFDELGGTRRREPGGAWCVDLPVPDDPDELPDSPAGRALRALAGGHDRRRGLFSFVFPWAWIGRRGGDEREAEA